METQHKCLECGALYEFDKGHCDQYCSRYCAEAAYLGSMSDRLYDEQVEYNLCI